MNMAFGRQTLVGR